MGATCHVCQTNDTQIYAKSSDYLFVVIFVFVWLEFALDLMGIHKLRYHFKRYFSLRLLDYCIFENNYTIRCDTTNFSVCSLILLVT